MRYRVSFIAEGDADDIRARIANTFGSEANVRLNSIPILGKRDRTRVMSVAEAAKAYGYSRVWVQKLLIAGTIEGTKNRSGHWRVTVGEMERIARDRQERNP